MSHTWSAQDLHKLASKAAACTSQRPNLMHAAPSRSRRHALRDCGKSRLHAYIFPLLARAQVLERMRVVVTNVPDHPIRHVHLCQAQAPSAAILQHDSIRRPAVQELNLGLAIEGHLLTLLNLGATEGVADAHVPH